MLYDWNLLLISNESNYIFHPPKNYISSENEIPGGFISNVKYRISCVNGNFISVVETEKFNKVLDSGYFEMENPIVSSFFGNYFIDTKGIVWKLETSLSNNPYKISCENFPKIVSIGCSRKHTIYIGADKSLWCEGYTDNNKFLDWPPKRKCTITNRLKKIPGFNDVLFVYNFEMNNVDHIFLLCENGKILKKDESYFNEICSSSNVISIGCFADNYGILNFTFLLSDGTVYRWIDNKKNRGLFYNQQCLKLRLKDIQRVDRFGWIMCNSGLFGKINGNLCKAIKIVHNDEAENSEFEIFPSSFLDFYVCEKNLVLIWSSNGDFGIVTDTPNGMTFEDFCLKDKLPLIRNQRAKSANK